MPLFIQDANVDTFLELDDHQFQHETTDISLPLYGYNSKLWILEDTRSCSSLVKWLLQPALHYCVLVDGDNERLEPNIRYFGWKKTSRNCQIFQGL